MLYCGSCKIWVQPIQWVEVALIGQLDLLESCPSCHEKLPHPEPVAART